jgi:hypothetical protein
VFSAFFPRQTLKRRHSLVTRRLKGKHIKQNLHKKNINKPKQTETVIFSRSDKFQPIFSGLDKLVSRVHLECVGESRSVLSTLDKLKRIELRMEQLTKELERMPPEKAKIAERASLDETI